MTDVRQKSIAWKNIKMLRSLRLRMLQHRSSKATGSNPLLPNWILILVTKPMGSKRQPEQIKMTDDEFKANLQAKFSLKCIFLTTVLVIGKCQFICFFKTNDWEFKIWLLITLEECPFQGVFDRPYQSGCYGIKIFFFRLSLCCNIYKTSWNKTFYCI